MARWFDETAKSAARRDVADTQHEGMTRRTVITRGAVVAGVAWTAPMLMQTRAYAGASLCPPPGVYCPGSTGPAQCCAVGTNCVVDLATGVASCATPDAPGGACTNQGVGVCTSSLGVKSNCNGKLLQCNACPKEYICGGEGAPCNTVDICSANLKCTASIGSTGSYCRKPCTTATGVKTGQPTGDPACNTGQICDSSGYCAQDCGPNGTNGNCQGFEACVTDSVTSKLICNYAQK